jgi:hypothetical protein
MNRIGGLRQLLNFIVAQIQEPHSGASSVHKLRLPIEF